MSEGMRVLNSDGGNTYVQDEDVHCDSSLAAPFSHMFRVDVSFLLFFSRFLRCVKRRDTLKTFSSAQTFV